MSIRVRLLANKMTRAVNPNVDATIKISDGYNIDESGTMIQSYTEQPIVFQLQSMPSKDLEHFDFINQQGQFVYGYANGMIPAIRRQLAKGTSIATFTPYGEDELSEWTVKHVEEMFNDWVRVVLWRQN